MSWFEQIQELVINVCYIQGLYGMFVFDVERGSL